jgi:hypothetical protein
MWIVQIVHWGCNAAPNQKWDINWDPLTGAFNVSSPVSEKCWDNVRAESGGRLSQYSCNTAPFDNMRFYLEYQGYLTNCGGASNRKVSIPSADPPVHVVTYVDTHPHN